MKEGTASHTARSVAARRLEYERATAPYGDPAADEALTSDVADGLTPGHNGMHEYIRARTAFFDRVVVTSLDRGVRQVVIGGAGYDGRALRYAKPGVRWFEVDHPATQADKRERISRLGLATPQLAFIPADFTADPVAEPLLAAGLDPGRAALFLFEGVAVYLEQPVMARVLTEFRRVTPVGSPLAISVSIEKATSQTRARFQERVAELGEPARTVLMFDQADALLLTAGWKLRQPSDRQRSAGLLLAHATTENQETANRQPERLPQAVVPATSASGSASLPTAAKAQPETAAVPPGNSTGNGTASGKDGPSQQPRAQRLARATSAQAAALPLSALLSQALVAFTIEADNEAERRLPHRTQNRGLAPGSPPGAPWLTSLLMYANCLRHLPDAGITVAELRARARTGTNLDGMRRWRYVTYTVAPEHPAARQAGSHPLPDGDRGPRRDAALALGQGKRPPPDALIRPTAWGIEARDIWRAVTEEVGSRWRDRLGAAGFAALRAALTGLVGQLDPALPDCLPILGYGLRTRREPGNSPRATARDTSSAGATASGPASPAIRAFPVDGAAAGGPVAGDPTAAGTLAAGLPLWALLSRSLIAFAAQYEAEPGPSLAISANILRVLTADGIHTKDVPVLAGVSRESVAMATGVLRKDGLVAEGPDPAGTRFKLTRLTARGVVARDEYPALAADIERDWRTRFGDATVTALRQALEPLAAGTPPRLFAGLEPHQDNWRARVPPPATLPHYPMTLHRGGYPDGS